MSHRRAESVLLAGLLLAWSSLATAAEAPGLQASLAAERTRLLAGSKTQVGVILTLQAPSADAEAVTAAVQMALVLDRSGSMSAAGKMDMVHAAGVELVDRLSSSDELGLVAYATDVELLRPLQGVSDSDGIKQIIQQITPTSSTNLGGGLQEGAALFGQAPRAGAVRRLLLLTDGLANTGETNPDVLAQWARYSFALGARVSCIGLGRDYNETLLTSLAHAGGGEFYHITRKDQLPDLFRRELEEGRTVVSEGLLAIVRTQAGARLLHVTGYPFTGGTEQAREVKIGDLFTREKRSLLLRFELSPPEGSTGADWSAAVLELRWTAGQQPRQVFLPLHFGVTAMETEVAESLNLEIRVRVLENENYQALENAAEWMRKGDSQKALELIKEAEERIKNDPAAAADRSLLDQAGQLAQARCEIEQRVDPNLIAKHNRQQGSIGMRGGSGRAVFAQVVRSGGNVHSTTSLERALNWLAAQQQADGHWDTGNGTLDGTALALLAYLGAGHTEMAGSYRENVQRAVQYLLAQQHADGRIGRPGALPAEILPRYRTVREHALITVALCEATGMGNRSDTREAAQKASDFLWAQRPFVELLPKLVNATGLNADDVAGAGFAVLALRSAGAVGLTVAPQAGMDLNSWLDTRASKHPPLKGCVSVFDAPSLLDAAVGIVCRQSVGAPSAETRPCAEWILAQADALPVWNTPGESFNYQYAYFMNLACFQAGGEVWHHWNAALNRVLLDAQATTGEWTATGPSPAHPIVLTAISALSQEVYYRYALLYRY